MKEKAQLPTPTLDTFGEGELAGLDERTADVLRMLSGMERREGGRPWTPRAVGDELGVSKGTVDALRRAGLASIRENRERERGML